MKKNHLLLSLALLMAVFAQAQTQPMNSFIEEHKRDKAFTFAYLSKDLFEVVTQSEVSEHDWKKVHQVVKNIGSLSVLTAKNIDNGTSLYKEARDLVPADEFDELLTIRDGQQNVRIWTRDEGNVVTDLILLVGAPDQFVLICFAGQIELGNVMDLAKLFDAEEAEHLARTCEDVAIDFQINPNPSNGIFTLSYEADLDVPEMLTVTDQNGRLVANVRLSGAATQQIVLQEIPAGLYWMQLKTKTGNVGVKQVQVVK